MAYSAYSASPGDAAAAPGEALAGARGAQLFGERSASLQAAEGGRYGKFLGDFHGIFHGVFHGIYLLKMVIYLLKMVIFHGKLLVITRWQWGFPWDLTMDRDWT